MTDNANRWRPGTAWRTWWLRIASVCVVMLAAGQQAHGHALEQSYVFLRISDTVIEGQFEVSLPDLNKGLGYDFPDDLGVELADIKPHRDAIAAYLLDRVKFTIDGRPTAARVTGHDIFSTSFTQFVIVNFSLGELPEPAKHVDIDYNVLLDELPGHVGMLVVTDDWKASTFNNESEVALVFQPDSRQQRLDLTNTSAWRGFTGLVRLGMHHIWIGIDHILFLLALVLPCVLRRDESGWAPVSSARTALLNLVKIVTLFTIAHSVTLAISGFGVLELPSRLVESVIAFSIAVAALDILVPIFRRRIAWVVVGFGLFHGFGFASVLGEIGIPDKYLPISLLGFNVGVEIGQLAIVAVAFPVLFVLRKTLLYRGLMMPAGAMALIAISLYWFTERAFDVDLPAGAIVNSLLGRAA